MEWPQAPRTTLVFQDSDDLEDGAEEVEDGIYFPIKIKNIPAADDFSSLPNGFLKKELKMKTGFLGKVKHTFTVFFYLKKEDDDEDDDEGIPTLGVYFRAEPSSVGTNRVIVVQNIEVGTYESRMRMAQQLPRKSTGGRRVGTTRRVVYKPRKSTGGCNFKMTSMYESLPDAEEGSAPVNWEGDKLGQFFYVDVSARNEVHLKIGVVCKKPEIEFVEAVDSEDDEEDDEAPAAKMSKVCEQEGTGLRASGYYLSEEFSDVTIQCGDGVVLPAHRYPLICGSDYFSRMFTNELDDAKTGVINFPEPSDCVKELLRFIYTGKSPSISADLFIAADKYLLDELKGRCESHLVEGITPENAVEMLELGRIHGGQTLEEKAKKVMFSNKDKIMKDAETWKEFTNKYPDLSLELLKQGY